MKDTESRQDVFDDIQRMITEILNKLKNDAKTRKSRR